MSSDVIITASLNPFRNEGHGWIEPPGRTIDEVVEGLQIRGELRILARVTLNGIDVPERCWRRVRPMAGAHLAVAVVPALDGGPSVIPKDTLRLILGVTSTVAGALIPGALGLSGVGATLATLGISGVGILATNALIPIPGDVKDEQTYTVTGVGNRLRPYDPVPIIYGTVRTVPPLLGFPRSYVEGGVDQFLTTGYLIGYGPLELNDFRIGETPAADVRGLTTRVLGAAGKGSSGTQFEIYTDDVYDEEVGAKLSYAQDFVTTADETDSAILQRTSLDGVSSLGVELLFPAGLTYRSDGRNDPWRVDLRIQYRLHAVEGAQWLDVSPPREDVINAQLAETNEDVIYSWLEDLNDDLQSLVDDLQFIFAETPGWWDGPIDVLNGLQQVLQRVIDVLGAERDAQAGNEPRETLVTGMLANVVELLDKVLVMGTGTANAIVGGWLDSLAQTGGLIGDLVLANQILAAGYSDDSVVRDILVRAMIVWQGKEAIFGPKPEGAFYVVDNRAGQIRKHVRWPVHQGRYDVRVMRVSEESENASVADEAQWAFLRSVRQQNPVRDPEGLTMVEMKVRAGEQTAGNVDRWSCVATAVLPAWDGSAWSSATREAGRNPAWVFADILRRHAGLSDDRLDLDSLSEWADYCDTEGFQVNVVINDDMTTWDALKRVAALGRATIRLDDGRYSVVIDRERDVPVQMFTPRNLRNFRASRSYRARTDGLRMTFTNPSADWAEDELVVCADGYYYYHPAEGAAPAEYIEDVRLWGVVDVPDDPGHEYHTGLVMQHALYYLGVLALRPEQYEVEVDAEHLVARRGDRVLLTHDVLMVGSGWGRLTEVTVDGGGAVTAAKVDEYVTMEAGKTYRARVRRSDGTIVAADLVLDVGSSQSISFSPAIPASDPPVAAGDLIVWGEADLETLDCIVKEIRPGADLSATLLLEPYAPEIFTLRAGEAIPDFRPKITNPPLYELVVPQAPVIVDIRSDEAVLTRGTDGGLEPRIVVRLRQPGASTNFDVRAVEVQFRGSLSHSLGDANKVGLDQGDWGTQATFSRTINEVSIAPVEAGQLYDFRVRNVSASGVVSEWTTILKHRVIGKTTPPPPVDYLLFDGRVARWYLLNPPPDIYGYILRVGVGSDVAWDDAASAHGGILTASSYDFGQRLSGTITLLVKAVDLAGLESESATAVTVNLGDPALENVVLRTQHKALGWPGTRAGWTIDGSGNLTGNALDGPFWRSDGVAFWRTGDFWLDLYADCEYAWTHEVDADDLPGYLYLEHTYAGETVSIWYRKATTGDVWPDPLSEDFWPANVDDELWPGGQEWLPWPGFSSAESGTYSFRFMVGGGPTQPELSRLNVVLDVPDVTETIEGMAIASGGTRVPITRTYRSIVSVAASIADVVGTTAVVVRVVDKNATTGPLLKAYDSAGSSVAATADVTIRGY